MKEKNSTHIFLKGGTPWTTQIHTGSFDWVVLYFYIVSRLFLLFLFSTFFFG